jgi:lipoteichoic acid synthase
MKFSQPRAGTHTMASIVEKPCSSVWQRAPSLIQHGIGHLGRALWQPLPRATTEPRSSAAPRTLGLIHGELVSLVLFVCLAIFVTKAALAYNSLASAAMAGQICDDDWLGTVGRIAACCAEDFAVGFCCLLAAGIAFSCCPSTTLRWSLRVLAYGAALVALVLLAINAHLFRNMRCFLTATEVHMAAGFEWADTMQDAAGAAVQLTLVLLPLGTLALHLALIRACPRFWALAARGLCRPILLIALILGFFGLSKAVHAGDLFDAYGDFARSPHLLLVQSCFGQQDVLIVEDGTTTDDSDFLPGRPRLAHVALPKRPTNIVVIVLESVATTYLDMFGGPWPLTPRLNERIKKGMVFDNFYANANHSIASGLPLFGSTYNDPQYKATIMEYPEYPVPAASTWLKKHGYKTYFLGAAGWGIWEGFLSMVPSFIDKKFDVERDVEHPFWSTTPRPRRIFKWEYHDEALFADAKRALHDAKGQKFFLMLWNYGTHWPYTPEGDTPLTFDERLFPAAIRNDPEKKDEFVKFLQSIYRVDAFIDDFYRELEKLGLADDTLVVITADHGETFGQHLGLIHGHSVYEEEVHVPLIMLNRHLARLGPRSPVIGSHVDMWPTIMDICALPCDPRWQGRSLLGVSPDEARRAYFASRANQHCGVRQGKYKYILDGKNRRDLLYDLEADPEERVNLAERERELTAQLRRRVMEWRSYMARYTKERVEEREP